MVQSYNKNKIMYNKNDILFQNRVNILVHSEINVK